MRFHARMLFTLSIIAVAAYAVYTSQDWPLGTRLFPWVVGVPVLALSLVQIGLELYQALRPEQTNKVETGDLQVDWGMTTTVVAQKAGAYFGWLLALFFGVWIFGFFVAIPLYAFLYLKIQAQEGWIASLTLTLGVCIFFVGLFDQILHIAWPNPLLPMPEDFVKRLMPFVD
jgi:hypothetical protein